MVEIPNAESLTKKEKQALWYPEPIERKKPNKIKKILCAIDLTDDEYDQEARDDDDDDDFFDENGYRRRLPVCAVLEEQRSQRELGLPVNPDFLANIYRKCSAHSVLSSHRRALQVAVEAREYYLEWSKSSSWRMGRNVFRRSG